MLFRSRLEYSGPTWIQIVEDLLKVLEVHYGYNIRDHVYYAVKCPVFDHDFSPAPGREIHKDKFLDLLSENPELNNGGKHQSYKW